MASFSSHEDAIRIELRKAAERFASKSDQRTALSMAASTQALTEKQIGFAHALIRRAQGGGAKQKVEGDLWEAEAPAEVAKPGASGPTQFVEVNASDLEACVGKVLAPLMAGVQQAFAQRSDALENTLNAKQDAFNRGAAQKIAQETVRLALAELDKRVPREVVVKVQDGAGTREVAGAKHAQFEHLLRAASLRLADGYAPGIFLAGERSSGKSHGTKQLAGALGRAYHFNGAISFPHEMLGFIDAGGKYHRTPFREAYEHGGVYCFDEVDRSDPVALLAVNPHLANGLATFPDAQIKRHRDCVIVCTANTWGHGASAEYSGACKLDGAFLSRFPVQIEWNIDGALEEALIGKGAWLDRVRAVRKRMSEKGMKATVDVRTAQAGKALIAAGYSLTEAARMTYLAALKPDQRKMLEGV